jgi:hypothetical protein
MMPPEKITLPWQELRPWEGSVRKSFEQMCNQFASHEAVPSGSQFVPVAAPDGGIECYWIYPNDSEWGFQAKFWTSPEQVDFSQLDTSIKRALATHPKLTRYTVCLPIDRQDPRKPGQTWLKDRWDEHEAKWREWAGQQQMSVAFDYWGETELSTRFSMEKHAGRFYFWFHKDLFSDTWFSNRLEETRANAEPRYSPNLNVSLDLSDVFDALVRGDHFRGSITKHLTAIRKVSPFVITTEIAFASTEGKKLNATVATVLNQLNAVLSAPVTTRLNWDQMIEPVRTAINAASTFLRALRNYTEEKQQEHAEQRANYNHPTIGTLPSLLNMHKGHTGTLIEALEELLFFFDSDVAHAADAPALLLTGSAGIGKTHFLCDFAFSRLRHGAAAILLLGQHFLGTENPWQQVRSQLGLQCTPEQFLGALDASGQVRGQSTVLMIDALNEGQGRRLWHSQLAGFLVLARRYPFIKVVLSVRRTYLDACVPEHLSEEMLLHVEHHGFANNVADAVQVFFNFYKIVLPSAPILNPEFQNPLFLKVFCQGLFNRGLQIVPKGMSGMNAVFTSFLESIDDKLSKPDRLDFDPRRRVVFKATERLADAMAQKNTSSLDREEANRILQELYSSTGYEQSLLRNLISEGLLSEDIVPGEEDIEVVQFAYERLSDYLIAKRLLETHFDSKNPDVCFRTGGALHNFVENEWAASMAQGLIEAFTVHLPELHGLEFADIVGSAKSYRAVRSAFTATFSLRSEKAFSSATVDYINKVILQNGSDTYDFNEALVSLATQPSHPFNARRLHSYLNRMTMPLRDSLWTIYLWESFDRRGATRRLVEWAAGDSDLSILNDTACILSGLALGWILTSSNRTQRDTATKGLARLFTDRLRPLLSVLRVLSEANDPYVVERILASAYGAAMRTQDNSGLEPLAQWAYDHFFAKGQPPANILIRDYARGIIEFALHRSTTLAIDISKIRPPYTSSWPQSIPSREELETAYGWNDQGKNKVWLAWHSIFYSVMGGGDFARYVIGTNWGSFHWLSIPLTEPRPKETSRYRHSEPNLHFDLDIAQRWIFHRVVELGWTPELFENFDRSVSNQFRRADKPERIGKKYQWIAYYEFVALVADNFHYASNSSDPGDQQYEGPWQVTSARNIDPSSLLTRNLADEDRPVWWLPLDYNLQADPVIDTWLHDASDIPVISGMLKVTDPADSSLWLVLEGLRKISDPRPPGEDRFDTPFRQIWIEVRAYLVKKEDESKVFAWMLDQNFWGRWMPESSAQTKVFMGEYFWAPAYKAVDNYYNGNSGWSREEPPELPAPLAQTTALYLGERGYDCSVEESVSVSLPSKTLSTGLNLVWSGRDSTFNDQEGNRAVYDPSAFASGPRALLARQDVVAKFLADRGLALVWTVMGGKEYMERDPKDWKGEMQINGAYRLSDSGVEGTVRGKYHGRS